MSEEEKKAIEIVQGLKVYYDNDCLLDEEEIEENKTVNNAIDMVLNLLEKQQKEIVQEKEKNKELEEHQRQYLDGELITAKQGKFFEKMIKENYIRKDKIKEKIDLFRNRFNAENGVKTINYHLYSILIEEFSSLLEDEI